MVFESLVWENKTRISFKDHRMKLDVRIKKVNTIKKTIYWVQTKRIKERNRIKQENTQSKKGKRIKERLKNNKYTHTSETHTKQRKMPCSAVTLSLATIAAIVSVALLAIAFSTDNWLSYEVKRNTIQVCVNDDNNDEDDLFVFIIFSFISSFFSLILCVGSSYPLD